MFFKELRYVFIDDNFTVLRVIKMALYQAILTDETLVLTTEFLSNLMRMRVTISQRYRKTLLYLFDKMLVCTYLNRFIIINLCTVIRVTERTIKLSFNDKILARTFDHEIFHALTASNFFTTLQLNWFSIFKIERKFTK